MPAESRSCAGSASAGKGAAVRFAGSEVRSGASRFLWLLLMLQLGLAAAGVVRWAAGSGPPPPPPLAAAPSLPVGATIDSDLAAVRRYVAAWRPDAELLRATMQVDWPWDPPPPRVDALPATGWLTYVFLAPTDPGDEAAALSLLVDRLNGEVVAQDVTTWPAPPPAPAPLPAVSAAAALLAAEAAGGTDFRRACPTERHLTRVALPIGGAVSPVWLVTYEDRQRPGRAALEIRIDATAGGVVDVETEAPPCPGDGTGRG